MHTRAQWQTFEEQAAATQQQRLLVPAAKSL